MLGDALKAIELLMNSLHATPERKRRQIAKELMTVYFDICTIVTRGRQILKAISLIDRSSHREMPLRKHPPFKRSLSITLLTVQQQALKDLRDRLTTGSISHVLKLHLPSTLSDLLLLSEIKGSRVWFSLDQLVSDGSSLSPAEWVQRLEERMLPAEKMFIERHDLRSWRRHEDGHYLLLSDFSEYASERTSVVAIHTDEEIRRGLELLDSIARGGEELRKFLIEKFKLEDVL